MIRRQPDVTWLDTLTVTSVAIFLYLLTAAPDLYYTDCGELAAVCVTLGVAHPTGYPLLTLIGHLWQLLPLPLNPIGRLNFMIVLLSAGAVAIGHRLILRLLSSWKHMQARDRRIIAAIGALLIMTARTLWQQALSMEVHALQVFLIICVFYWLLRWYDSRHRLHAIVASLALGLCFTNHMTAIVLIPGVLTFTLIVERGSWNERLQYLILPLTVVVCCSVFYVYLPLRSSMEPLFNWGEVHRSLDKFLYHVLGKQYSVWLFSGSMKTQLSVFGHLLLPNVAVPFTLWGMWILWRRHREVAVLLGLVTVSCITYVSNYGIQDIEPYYNVAFLAMAIATPIGIAAIWRWRMMRLIACMMPFVYGVWNWRPNDLHNHWLVREYVKLVVDPLPKGSILLSQQWDYFCSAFWYMQQVEGYRRDIVMIEKELLRRTWYIPQLQRWYGESIRRCSAEIAAYIPLLEEFESGQMPQQRYRIIQNAFVNLLRAFVERNRDRFAFATPEVVETEPEMASSFELLPYGATIVLHSVGSTLPPPPREPELTRLLESARHNFQGRLDRGLLHLASSALVQFGDVYKQHDTVDHKRTLECYRAALALNPRNTTASDRLRRFYE